MPRVSAHQVADILIQHAIDTEAGELLTNMKLQKLLYYAQGCHLAVFGEPLFDDAIEAWTYGPVVPTVYQTYKVCGRQPIEMPAGDANAVNRDLADFLSVIAETFGQFSALALMKMTHKEAPWASAYQSGLNAPISMDHLAAFVRERWLRGDFNQTEDDLDYDLARKLKNAEAEAEQLPSESGDDVLAWLDKVGEGQPS
jgi:uncharacterized phage-associated protein